MAYADPPYPRQAQKHYACPEVNHEFLIRDLSEQFPDGWALSTSSTALREVLPLCPPTVRVGAWVKPFCSFKKNVTKAYAWEPVIFSGGRARPASLPTVRDWVSCNITLRRGTSGAKPEDFCWWVFDMLGLLAGDEFVDLFHGSGAVTRAWESYRSERLFGGAA